MIGREALRGAGTALVTPFTAAGAVDDAALAAFVKWQIREGIHYVVPCGSTGEAATLSPAEQLRVVQITVETARGRVAVVAGAGSNDTRRAIESSRAMQAAGATHLLHASPMYSKPPQRGIVAHFRAIADSVQIPIIMYNVPGRTASNMEAATTLELAEHPNIMAVKEASGDLSQITEIIRHRPEEFSVLSGDDALTLAVLAEGGDGVVSVTANVIPRTIARLCDAGLRGDLTAARALHQRVARLTTVAFVESNPIPIKAALAMMDKMGNTLRLPLMPLAEVHEAELRGALVAAGAVTA